MGGLTSLASTIGHLQYFVTKCFGRRSFIA
jgi:hypothetical protein